MTSLPARFAPRFALAALAAATVTATAPAKPPAVTSAYTPLDLEKCRMVEDADEGGGARWTCRGHGGIALIVEVGDDRFDLDAGVEDRDELWGDTFDSPPATVEWRLHRGRPFALIYRLTNANVDRPRSSRLMVETIGRPGKPGCRVADIPGSAPDANQAARAAADRIRAGTARCLTPR